MGRLISTNVPRQFNKEGTVFSTNGSGTMGLHAKKCTETLTSHHTQISTQDGS